MNTSTTSVEKISEALKLLEEAAKDKKDELQNIIKGRYNHLKDALLDKEDDVVKALKAARKHAVSAARQATEMGTEKAKELAEEIEDRVRENPWPYLGGVAIGALLIGYILGRK
jgi:DNA phosphorothioation-dependent restriction protein DptG